MSKNDHHRESVRVQLTETSTQTEEANPAGWTDSTLLDVERAESFGMGKKQLLEHYDALVRAGAIYYPVAYQFLHELGRGRQGIVFLGLRQGARGCITRHAIKLFDPGIYPDARRYWTDMGRIASQISKLQSVRTPYLVSREAYEESNGIGYSQMEAIDGITVWHLLSQEWFNRARDMTSTAEWAHITDVIFKVTGDRVAIQPGIVIYLMRQVLRALEVLHENGFVHSDIKPSNVMVDRLGNARVIDYGRAVQIGERVSVLFGTPYYMAPETHRRDPSVAQSDLYSVGLLGIELLTGRPLINSKDEEELLDFKMTLPDRLHEFMPQYVQESQMFMNMLRDFINPDPERRHPGAREAEGGEAGLSIMHRELAKMDVDADYGRELENYLSRFVNPLTKRIEM